MRGPSGPFLSLIGGQMQIIAFFGATPVSPPRTYPLVILPKPAPFFFIFLIVYKKEMGFCPIALPFGNISPFNRMLKYLFYDTPSPNPLKSGSAFPAKTRHVGCLS